MIILPPTSAIRDFSYGHFWGASERVRPPGDDGDVQNPRSMAVRHEG